MTASSPHAEFNTTLGYVCFCMNTDKISVTSEDKTEAEVPRVEFVGRRRTQRRRLSSTSTWQFLLAKQNWVERQRIVMNCS